VRSVQQLDVDSCQIHCQANDSMSNVSQLVRFILHKEWHIDCDASWHCLVAIR